MPSKISLNPQKSNQYPFSYRWPTSFKYNSKQGDLNKKLSKHAEQRPSITREITLAIFFPVKERYELQNKY